MQVAPSRFRETLRLLARHDPARGLDNLFGSVDWSGASSRQLAHAFLGRPPADGAAPLSDPRAEARRLFESDEFRRGLLRRVVTAFPGKQRLLFVHLPKCAGTDFESAMRADHASLHQSLDWAGIVDAAEIATRLHGFLRQLQKSNTIFVGGHVPLRWYIDNELYRYEDRLMTIIRHPHEIAISFANYILHCMRGDPDFRTRDVKHWGGVAGIARYDPAWPAETVKELGRRIATQPGLMPINPICALLGDGTADATFRNLARVDIEITDVTRYSAWLKTTWGIDRKVRANAAPQVVSAADLSAGDRARIEAACTEDIKVYEAIMGRLRSTVGLSVTGPELGAA